MIKMAKKFTLSGDDEGFNPADHEQWKADNLNPDGTMRTNLNDIALQVGHAVRALDGDQHSAQNLDLPHMNNLERLLQHDLMPAVLLLGADIKAPADLLIREKKLERIAAAAFRLDADEVQVQHITRVVASGAEIQSLAPFSYLDERAKESGSAQLIDHLDFSKKNTLDQVFLVTLKRSHEAHWMEDIGGTLVPCGTRIQAPERATQDKYVRVQSHALEEKPSFSRDALGPYMTWDEFFPSAQKELEQHYSGQLNSDFEAELMNIGIPGQSGPIVRVTIRNGEQELLSLTHLVSNELSASFMRMMKAKNDNAQQKPIGKFGWLKNLLRKP